MLSFKLALKEIFEAEMLSGGKLYGLCDGVLGTAVEALPTNYNKYIILGHYRVGEVRIGELQKKFRAVELDIECGAVVRKGVNNAEVNAEEAAYLIAKKVRTILKGNKTLVSTTYTNGVAIASEAVDEMLDYVMHDGVPVAFNVISYYMKIIEED